MKLADIATDATKVDTWDVERFEGSKEWVRISKIAKQALVIFAERGRFSEEYEEDLMM